MTRAHFKVIAEVMRTVSGKLPEEDYRTLVIHMGNRLSQFNDNFDFGKFEEACGL